MRSSGRERINVLARHLTSSGAHAIGPLQQKLCEAQSDDGKIITADQAAALIPDNAVITVRLDVALPNICTMYIPH